jgi:hypothetical protein
LLAALAFPACHSPPEPNAAPPLAMERAIPVVFVPGVTGSKLRNRATGKVAFGRGIDMVLPRDDGYGIALSIDPDTDSELEAFAVVDRVRFAFSSVEVYGSLIELLEENGYRVGDLSGPRATETLYPFAYDWRRETAETARILLEKLRRLREVRGDEVMPVVLVCQSTGGQICRYLLRYSGASLEAAAAGDAGPPAWLRVARLILISSSNGGSIRTLRELDRGRRYVRGFGRFFAPETLFSFASLYSDLPCWRNDLFVDARGTPLDVDLCDAASWERYGWSAFGAGAAQRLERAGRSDLFGSVEQRRTYLRGVLARAARLQRLLREDAPAFPATPYFLIQDRSRQTPDRAVLVAADGAWHTLFAGDAEVDRQPELRDRVTTKGDGHASAASQLWLSPQERSAMPHSPYYVEGGHFELIHAPATRRHLLELLDERTF